MPSYARVGKVPSKISTNSSPRGVRYVATTLFFVSIAMKPDIRTLLWRVPLHADDAGKSFHDFPMDGGDEKSNPGRRTASPTFLSLLYRRRRSQNKGTFASGEQNDLSRLNSVSKVRLSDDLVSISVKLL